MRCRQLHHSQTVVVSIKQTICSRGSVVLTALGSGMGASRRRRGLLRDPVAGPQPEPPHATNQDHLPGWPDALAEVVSKTAGVTGNPTDKPVPVARGDKLAGQHAACGHAAPPNDHRRTLRASDPRRKIRRSTVPCTLARTRNLKLRNTKKPRIFRGLRLLATWCKNVQYPRQESNLRPCL